MKTESSQISRELVRVQLASLKPHPKNPKDHDIEAIKDSIVHNGRLDPIEVDEKGVILAGHGRCQALQELGFTEDEVIRYTGLSEKQKEDYVLRANTTTMRRGFLDDKLKLFDKDVLVRSKFFTNAEMLRLFPFTNESRDDEIPKMPKVPKSKLGDIYQLGDHRIMCGSSSSAEDMARLMGGEHASITFTSPPYNLGGSAKLRGKTEIAKKGNAYSEYDDAQTEDGWLDLMVKFTDLALEHSDYAFVNVQSLAGNRMALWEYAHHFAPQYVDVAIWDKGHAAPAAAQRVMNSVFEFVFIYTKSKKASRAIHAGGGFRGTLDNIFRLPPQKNNDFADLHGATFPVHLPLEFIKHFTNESDGVIDSFLGTGTTVIACEKTGRKCFGMDIDPAYIDVSVERWEKFTGKKAVKV